MIISIAMTQQYARLPIDFRWENRFEMQKKNRSTSTASHIFIHKNIHVAMAWPHRQFCHFSFVPHQFIYLMHTPFQSIRNYSRLRPFNLTTMTTTTKKFFHTIISFTSSRSLSVSHVVLQCERIKRSKNSIIAHIRCELNVKTNPFTSWALCPVRIK